MKKKIGVLTSGGDAPGMNAAIRAVVRTGLNFGMEVYGIERGYEGLIEGDVVRLTASSVSDILQRGGTMLKTARSERFKSFFGQDKAIEVIEDNELSGLITIGGDGTFRGACDLSRRGVSVIGIPCTIDNDQGYTDYTIGFDTAVNTVLHAIGNIRDTSTAHERISIIEVMGRRCGDIAMYAGVCGGADQIIIPEVPLDLDAIVEKNMPGKSRVKKHNIIIKAEGVGISSQELADLIAEKTGQEVKVVILAYLQRGGMPSARDRLLASLMGSRAVELLENDSSSKALAINGSEIKEWDIEEAVKVQREPDLELMQLIEMLAR